MNILAACTGADSPVRKFVFKCSAHYYGCEQDDPAFFTEGMRRPHPPRHADRARHRRGRGARSPTSPSKHPDVDGHRAALRQRARPRRRHRVHPHVRRCRLVPMVLGFDPRLQFVHEDDVVHALEHAAINEVPGIYNVAADGVLALSEAIALLGKRPLPVLPPLGTGLARRRRCAGSASASPTRCSTSSASAAASTTALQGDRLPLRLHLARDRDQARRAPAPAPDPARRRARSYRYEREVEEFLRWSPHVRRERRRRRASPPSASRSGSEQRGLRP